MARGGDRGGLYRVWWALIALTAGVGMLYRYLKFHRLYSVEVFVGYPELPSPTTRGE